MANESVGFQYDPYNWRHDRESVGGWLLFSYELANRAVPRLVGALSLDMMDPTRMVD